MNETLVDLGNKNTNLWKDIAERLREYVKETYGLVIDFGDFYSGFKKVRKKVGNSAFMDVYGLFERLENEAAVKTSGPYYRGTALLTDIEYLLISSGRSVNGNDNPCFAVVSNNFSSTILLSLKKFGLHDKFRVIVGRDTVKRLKPSPDGLEYVSTRCPCMDKRRIVFFGDSDVDRAAASSLGIDFFFIQNYNPAQKAFLIPDKNGSIKTERFGGIRGAEV